MKKSQLPALLSPMFLDPKKARKEIEELHSIVTESWNGDVAFAEKQTKDWQLLKSGLRPTQTGTLYALAAHWTASTKVATIAILTSTGKTEIMIAANF